MKKKEVNKTIAALDEQILNETNKLSNITDADEREKQGKLIESLAKAKAELLKSLTEAKFKLPETILGGVGAFGVIFTVFSKIYEVWSRRSVQNRVLDVEEHSYINTQATDFKH